MKYIVQFGAGNIGRSLVGTLFTQAGYRVVFVDAVPEIIAALNTHKGYHVLLKDNLHPEGLVQHVEGVRGILATDIEAVTAAVAGAELVCTAVGARALPKIMPLIARSMVLRQEPLSVILCENLPNASQFAMEHLRDALPHEHDILGRIGIVETSIGKMVPLMPEAVRKQNPLTVWAEPYNCIIANREGFIGEPPEISGLLLKNNFTAWVERKLFVHNLGHAACAWHGYLHGHAYIWQCLQDPWIKNEVREVMHESARALVSCYPQAFTKEELSEHINDLLERFSNQALGDTVFRVGRDLVRKMGRGERVMGALRLCQSQGIDPEHICRAIAAGLNFRATDENGQSYMQDQDFAHSLESDGVQRAIAQVSGLSPKKDQTLLERIISRYNAFCPALLP